MKRVIPFMLSVLFAFPALSDTKDIKQMSFKGRVINVAADYVEIKKKNIEHVFYITSKSVIIMAGAEKKAGDLMICQSVKVEYRVVKKRKEIVKLEIIKESDCLK